MSGKSVTFDPNIPFNEEKKTSKEVQKLSDEERKMNNKLLRVIDNTIHKSYQNDRTNSYLNSLKESRLTDLFTRLKHILPENVNLSSVINFIIFVIKKYYTGYNGYWHVKSNSFKKRSILLYCLDYLFGINTDVNVITTKMFKYTENELHNTNYRCSFEKLDWFKTCSAADMILLILSTNKDLCPRITVHSEYVAHYRQNPSQKVITLRSDITMGGLLNPIEGNDNRPSYVFGFMTDIFENENTAEKTTVKTIVENNDIETNDETIVDNNDEIIDENAVESNNDEIIDENAVESNNDKIIDENTVESNNDEIIDENNDDEITPGNTRVELTVKINDKNHLMNNQILTTVFIVASVLITFIVK